VARDGPARVLIGAHGAAASPLYAGASLNYLAVRLQAGESWRYQPAVNHRYVRVMGLKEETVQGIGFKSLAIFRPGIIAGNAHTPSFVAWLGRLIPGPFWTIEQDDIGRAFVAEFISSSAPNGVVYLENGAMRQRSRDCDKLATHIVLDGELRHHCDTQASDHRAPYSVGMYEHGRSRRRR
jgi:hypothetical protein